jgi:hypothetical protein
MREALGWLTNCPDDRRCPQNWLELCYTELPTTMRCHVCEREVRLVTTESDFEVALEEQEQAAFPVVPCIGAPATYGRLQGQPVAPSIPPDSGDNGVPEEVEEEAAPPPSAPPPPPPAKGATVSLSKALFCILGSGDAIRVEKDSAIVGRSRNCDIVIPSAKVSRQHASISRVADDYFIEDLGSANGVWRDGEKMAGRVKIEHGDVFTISEESLTFEFR